MAAAEGLRYCEHERACKPTTLRDYRHSLSVHLLPAFGDLALEDVSVEMVERWRRGLQRSPRTKNKLLTVLNGVFRRAKRVYGCQHNPVTDIDRLRERARTDLDVFSPEEVSRSAIFPTAAFTGLARHRLRPLAHPRVRSSYAGGMLTTPKSGRVRSVPLSTQTPRGSRGWPSADGRSATTTSCSWERSAATSTDRP